MVPPNRVKSIDVMVLEGLKKRSSNAHNKRKPRAARNVDAVRAINKQTSRSTPRGVIAQNRVAHRKGPAVALAKQGGPAAPQTPVDQNGSRPKVDNSVLAISEPKRVRSKEHLRFVAAQPCVICGRSPAHAHHIR